LELKYDEALSSFVFDFSLRRYSTVKNNPLCKLGMIEQPETAKMTE
jgi:hypothetical protein